MKDTAVIRAYHERTKHRLDGYARGPEYLDWDSQPDPFRHFDGAPLDRLPLVPDSPPDALSDALPDHCADAADNRYPLNRAGISKLLELSMGLSAWKAFGPDRWALRCNPSSGNLHPTEAYIVSNGIDGLQDGVHHYRPREHALEQRADLIAGHTLDHDSSFCLLGLTSIAWREAWKYGERAYRYVQLDVGHALGAVRYATAVLGWQIAVLPLVDTEISDLLGLSRADDFAGAEREQPDLVIQVMPGSERSPVSLPKTRNWQGQANALYGDPYLDWPVIAQAHAACVCEAVEPNDAPVSTCWISSIEPQQLAGLIRQRRSAQAFIGRQSTMPMESFEKILAALMPSPETAPWDCWPYPVRLHPVFFIHRVDGIEPGLYALPRNAQAKALLQSAMSDDFDWRPVVHLDGGTKLYRLTSGDARKLARTLSCHQEIASASSFSLAMLSEYENGLTSDACAYRHLHWEAGLLGQVLYLWAEQVGMRGTGIGCFFDDSVHEVLGITDTRLQSLYHFTVGSPRTDPRLETLPPYPHSEMRDRNHN